MEPALPGGEDTAPGHIHILCLSPEQLPPIAMGQLCLELLSEQRQGKNSWVKLPPRTREPSPLPKGTQHWLHRNVVVMVPNPTVGSIWLWGAALSHPYIPLPQPPYNAVEASEPPRLPTGQGSNCLNSRDVLAGQFDPWGEGSSFPLAWDSSQVPCR